MVLHFHPCVWKWITLLSALRGQLDNIQTIYVFLFVYDSLFFEQHFFLEKKVQQIKFIITVVGITFNIIIIVNNTSIRTVLANSNIQLSWLNKIKSWSQNGCFLSTSAPDQTQLHSPICSVMVKQVLWVHTAWRLGFKCTHSLSNLSSDTKESNNCHAIMI